MPCVEKGNIRHFMTDKDIRKKSSKIKRLAPNKAFIVMF